MRELQIRTPPAFNKLAYTYMYKIFINRPPCFPVNPEGPSTQYLRTLVPRTISLMAFGTRVLEILGTWTLWQNQTMVGERLQSPGLPLQYHEAVEKVYGW